MLNYATYIRINNHSRNIWSLTSNDKTNGFWGRQPTTTLLVGEDTGGEGGKPDTFSIDMNSLGRKVRGSGGSIIYNSMDGISLRVNFNCRMDGANNGEVYLVKDDNLHPHKVKWRAGTGIGSEWTGYKENTVPADGYPLFIELDIYGEPTTKTLEKKEYVKR